MYIGQMNGYQRLCGVIIMEMNRFESDLACRCKVNDELVFTVEAE